MSTGAGSHAGRGFRYQDAVTALFAIESWAGTEDHGLVIPEGRDDIELSRAAGHTLVQVKSRRDHLGPFSAKTVVGFLTALWSRERITENDRYLLVLEGHVGKDAVKVATAHALAAFPELLTAVRTSPKFAACHAATALLILPSPSEAALAIVQTARGCNALEANAYLSAVQRVVGRLADANGLKKKGQYLGISTSDTQREFDTLQTVLTTDVAEQALRDGLCESVDFLTSTVDPDFYLGVDAQPSHVVAGLVVERPALREKVTTGLELRGNVLIHGPSGAGKSALMWEAAYSVRHTVRWFRVRRLAPRDVHLLVRLARACGVSSGTPVGFVLDDVGRGLADGWSSLAKEVAANPGLLLLGTSRAEDLYALAERARAVEIPAEGDADIAKRIWAQLAAAGQTQWQGWKEPWKQAGSLLLEYTHILTRGKRLHLTLRDQVAARAIDASREEELRILRLISCAATFGADVDVSKLAEAPGSSPGAVSRALQRLLDEHLVRQPDARHVGGLHDLRSAELFRLTHEVPPPLREDTLRAAVHVIPDEGLEQYLSRALHANAQFDDVLLDAVAHRLRTSPQAAALSAALRGLGNAQVLRAVAGWMLTNEARAVPAAQLGTAALFAVAGIELPEVFQDKPAAPAARKLAELIDSSNVNSLRQQLLDRLSGPLVKALLASATDVKTLTEVLDSFVGLAIEGNLAQAIGALQPDLLGAELEHVCELLGTARLLSPNIAIAWVERAGQDSLLQKVATSVPWVSLPLLERTPDGLVVRADVRYVAPSVQADVHAEVVHLCQRLLAIAPSADVVVSDAVAADGTPAGYGGFELATKRIPRANLPPKALVAWNRRWLVAVQQHSSPSSYTEYLSEASDLLRQLAATLGKLFDHWLRGAKLEPHVGRLGVLHDASRLLSAPKPPTDESAAEDSQKTTKLQHILFCCSADLVRRFGELPTGVNAYISWLDALLKDIDQALAEEPWELLDDAAAAQGLRALREHLLSLRDLAGEASQSGLSPILSHFNRNAKPGTALPAARLSVQRFLTRKMKALAEELRQGFASSCPKGSLYVAPSVLEMPLWPAIDVFLVVEVDTLEEWLSTVDTGWGEWRRVVGESRHLCAAPVIKGHIVAGCAIAGFDKPFPERNLSRWAKHSGLPLLQTARVDAFARILDPLQEVSGMDEFGYGSASRPFVERQARAAALAALESARAEFRRVSASAEVVGLVDALVTATLTGTCRLARQLAAQQRGELNDEVALVTQLVLALRAEDIQATGAPKAL